MKLRKGNTVIRLSDNAEGTVIEVKAYNQASISFDGVQCTYFTNTGEFKLKESSNVDNILHYYE